MNDYNLDYIDDLYVQYVRDPLVYRAGALIFLSNF